MENSLLPTTSSGSDFASRAKSYWSKTDGKVAQVLIGLLILFGGYAFIHYGIAALIFNTTWTLFKGVAALIGAGILWTIFTSKKVRYLLRLLIYHFTDIFIKKIDAKSRGMMYISQQKDNIQIMDEKRSILDGAIEYLNNLVEQRNEAIKENEGRFKAAQGKPKYRVVAEDAADALKADEEDNKEDMKNLSLLTGIRDALSDNYEYAVICLRKAERRVKRIIENREKMRNVRVAVDAGRSVILGGQDYDEFVTAEDEMVQEIANDVGYFKKFVNETKPFTDARQLQKEINVQSAFDRIKGLQANNKATIEEYKQRLQLGPGHEDDVVEMEKALGKSGEDDVFEKVTRKHLK